jgi:hypothetical protein
MNKHNNYAVILSPLSSVLMTWMKRAASCIRHEEDIIVSRFWIWLFPIKFEYKFSIWVKHSFLNNSGFFLEWKKKCSSSSITFRSLLENYENMFLEKLRSFNINNKLCLYSCKIKTNYIIEPFIENSNFENSRNMSHLNVMFLRGLCIQ